MKLKKGERRWSWAVMDSRVAPRIVAEGRRGRRSGFGMTPIPVASRPSVASDQLKYERKISDTIDCEGNLLGRYDDYP